MSPPCTDCNALPRFSTYKRCWDCHCTANATKPCKECGAPRWRNRALCLSCLRDRHGKARRAKWAEDPATKKAAQDYQREWLKAHPEFRKRRAKINNARRRERYATEPEFREKVRLDANAKRHNLTAEVYTSLLARGCEACGATDGLHVDHDHTCCPGKRTCGKCVRGVLCGDCNRALGFLRDDAERIRQLGAYLSSRRRTRTGAYAVTGGTD